MARAQRYHRTTYAVTEVINGVHHEFEVNFESESDPIVSISEDGMKAVVGYLAGDDNLRDPRKEFDQINHMICFSRRNYLGDEHNYEDSGSLKEALCREAIGDDDRFERMLEHLELRIEKVRGTRDYLDRTYWKDIDELKAEFYGKILDKHYEILPCYVYEHGGITMSTSSFSCPWDSGMVGIIYMSRAEILNNWGGKILTQALRKKARESMKGSVAEYDQYLTGDVHGVVTQRFMNVSDDPINNPEWEDLNEGDSCWGYYGEEYAKEELKGWIECEKKWLSEPFPPYVDPDQLAFDI